MSEDFFSDKYQNIVEIAQGGMGSLYKGHDVALDRPVAIKVPHPHFLKSDPDFSRRFLREGRAMARLDHENVIRVFGVEGSPTAPFMVMEFFDGRDIKQLLAEKGTLPVLQALSISIQMANALGYAHSQGIIHRDIKPANVMINATGKVKIADFGIAAVGGEEALTGTGMTLGTAQYMSPEQAKGHSLDGRADLYSLGIVLYEMLTGTNPYKGQSFESIIGRLIQPQEDYSLAFPKGIPQSLQELINALLKKDPKNRIPDAKIVSARFEKIKTDIEATLDNDATFILMPPQVETKRPFSISKLCFMLGLIALFLIAGGVGYYFWSQDKVVVPTPVTVTPKEPEQNPSATIPPLVLPERKPERLPSNARNPTGLIQKNKERLQPIKQDTNKVEAGEKTVIPLKMPTEVIVPSTPKPQQPEEIKKVAPPAPDIPIALPPHKVIESPPDKKPPPPEKRPMAPIIGF